VPGMNIPPSVIAPTNRNPNKDLAKSNADAVPELRFTVKLGSIVIGRFRECSGIAVEVETKDYMEGGNNDWVHKLPTRVKYPNVVLKRGITHESALLDWFNKAHTDYPANFQELTIEMRGPGGVTVRAWSFMDAYPIKWTGPNMNASSNQIATETLEMVHKGFKKA
jgi:phage tail-like protein